MSTPIENTQITVATSTTPSNSEGKRRPNKGPRKPRRNPNTIAWKLLPKSRDVQDIHSAAIVIGRGGKNQKSIEKATGTVLTVLNAKQQRSFKHIEVNTKDAQIMQIELNPDVSIEDLSEEQRINRAKQKIAKSIQYWRDIAFPPDDDGEEHEEQGNSHGHGHGEEQDATLAQSSA